MDLNALLLNVHHQQQQQQHSQQQHTTTPDKPYVINIYCLLLESLTLSIRNSNKQDVGNILNNIGRYLTSNMDKVTQAQTTPKKIEKKKKRKSRRSSRLVASQIVFNELHGEHISSSTSNSSSQMIVDSPQCTNGTDSLFSTSDFSSSCSSNSEGESDHETAVLTIMTDFFKQKDLEASLDSLNL
jgi:hypothetical protein